MNLDSNNPKPTLEKLEIQLTADCNLKCSYCGNSPVLRSNYHNWFSFDNFKKCIDELQPKTLVITGGEPTLAWQRLVECFSYSKEKGITNILTSNMSILGTEEIDFLIDECGVKGFNSSFNDYNIGMSAIVRGGYASERNKIINNFSHITNVRKLPLRVETILLKETVKFVPEIHKMLYNIGVRHHALEFLNPKGHAGWNMMLPTEELVDCVLNTYKAKQKGCILELTCCYLTPCLEEALEIYKIDDPELIFHRCLDGRQVAYILANGDMLPCFMFSGKVKPENIAEKNALDIWENNEIFKKLRTERPDECSRCKNWYSDKKPSCNNGCWSLMLMETGELNQRCGQYVRDTVRKVNSLPDTKIV